MILQIRKDYSDSIIPTKANPSDIGWDVYAHSMKVVGTKLIDNGNDLDSIWEEIDYIEYDTGISINPCPSTTFDGHYEEYYTYLDPRSSNRKYNLYMANSVGVIDRKYRGTVFASFGYKSQGKDMRFYPNFSETSVTSEGLSVSCGPRFGIKINKNKIYNIGDKIGQLIVTKQPYVCIEQKFGEWDATDRGTKGHGSSGR